MDALEEEGNDDDDDEDEDVVTAAMEGGDRNATTRGWTQRIGSQMRAWR